MVFQKYISIFSTTLFSDIADMLDKDTSQTYTGNPNGHLGSRICGYSLLG